MKSDIIYSPVITEKTSALAQNNVFVFKVAKNANKIQIKQAIEETFNVKVKSVNTLNTKQKELENTLDLEKLIRKLSLLYVKVVL